MKEDVKSFNRSILKSSNYLVVYKPLAQKIGLLETILLQYLIDQEEYFEKRGELTDKGEFYNTQEKIEKETTLNAYYQRKVLKRLKEFKLVEYQKKGLPAKYYFKVNHKCLKVLITDDEEFKGLYNEPNNEISFSIKKKSERKRSQGVSKKKLEEIAKLTGFKKPREDIAIILTYADAIGKKFNNKREKESFIKRNLKAAQLLKGYSLKKIYAWCQILPYLGLKKWTLETVAKFIDEDPIRIIEKYVSEDKLHEIFDELTQKGLFKEVRINEFEVDLKPQF